MSRPSSFMNTRRDMLRLAGWWGGWMTGLGATGRLGAEDAAVAQPSGAQHDWASFLGPTHNGISREANLNWNWPDQDPPIRWSIDLGTGYAPPAIAAGKLYHFDRYENRNRLTCRDAASARQRWTFSYETDYEDLLGYNNGPRAMPIIDDGLVYIVGPEGMLHAVRAEDGKKVWSVDTAAKFHLVQNFFGAGSAPVIYRDTLIAQVGGSPPGGPDHMYAGNARPNNQAVVGFDKKTGQVRFEVGNDLASYASPVLTQFHDRPWCFVFCRAGLVAFHPETGKLDFQFPWRAQEYNSVNASNPVVVGNQVLLSECYGPGAVLLSIEENGPTVVWKDEARSRRKALQTHWCTPIYNNGYVYASSGRHSAQAEFRCVRWNDGQVMWSEPRLQRASAILADGQLIVLSEDGTLRVVDPSPKEYREVRRITLAEPDQSPLLRYPAWAPPALSHKQLYLRGKGKLVCLDLG